MRASSTCLFGLFFLALGPACFGSPSGGGDTEQGPTSGTGTSASGSETSGTTATTTTTDPSASSNPGTTDTLPAGSGCCAPHEGPGCDEAAVQECVCDMDASCCGFDWSESCVDIAQARCEATCQPDATTDDTNSTSGPQTTDVSASGTFGSSGFGTTGFGSSGFGTTGGFGDDLCCYEGDGCAHTPTEQCVCDIDASCCDGEWTETCVGLAQSDCNACTSDDCCTPQTDPGCSDTKVETCVCDLDEYCCDTEYDYICADIASGKCGACG